LDNILSLALPVDTLYVNASHDNSVSMIREKVMDFCDAVPSSDDVFKLVILDEADSLTKQDTGAMAALKNVIEYHQSDTRFILTCNNINKITEPIQSRCRPIAITFSVEDVVKRIMQILTHEKVEYDKEVLVNFINTVVKKKFPDIRSIINEFEFWTIDGKLKPYTSLEDESDEIVEYIIKTSKARDIRKYLIQNETSFGRDYVTLAQNLFNKVNEPEHQLIIAESLYRMGIVVDHEIEFSSMMIQMKGIK